jgi:hypothetical protein
MLLQTNSYVVPKDRRSEHTRLLRKFRQTLLRLGCDSFEVYEQVGPNWAAGEATGRFVQIMRFRDRAQQQAVQEGEKSDPIAQQLIQEFCALINFPYQQQQGLFAVGFYNSALPVAPRATNPNPRPSAQAAQPESTAAVAEEVSTESSQPQSAMLELPPPASNPSQEQGSSMLDFEALAPAEESPAPLGLTSDAADEVIESDVATAEQSEAVEDDVVEAASNGEHPGAFAEDTVAGDEPLTEVDREAILGELTGDDTEVEEKGLK